MGFQSVEQSANFKKATELSVGDSFVAYFVGYQRSKYDTPDGRPQYNLLFQDKKSGDRVVLLPAGNLNYTRKDNLLKPGLLTQVTRQEDRTNKKGQKVTQFDRAQDPNDSIDVAAVGMPVEQGKSELEATQSNIEQLKLKGN